MAFPDGIREPEAAVPQEEGQEQEQIPFCSLEPEYSPTRVLPTDIDPRRAQLIGIISDKWTNGTVLRYYFFTSPQRWRGGQEQEDVVRRAFATWKGVGIGLEFREVFNQQEAELRIGFEQGAGSWSLVGRVNLDPRRLKSERTMNFGWDLRTSYGFGTALHEIGHALGFKHEHQNPKAGIVFDEAAVYRYFAGSPNFWSRQTTHFNILQKLDPNSVDGSSWDPTSIMHYHFVAGLILEPEKYRTQPLIPRTTLSPTDIAVARHFYPELSKTIFAPLRPFESAKFQADAGEQMDYTIEPTESRKYTIRTFGVLDALLVLFENFGDEPVLVAGDDDIGTEENAELNVRLHRGRSYSLRLRVVSSEGDAGVMVW